MLLLEFMLYIRTERHRTLSLLAMLGVVTAEGDKLLADGTAAVGLPFAQFRVADHPFHLLARR